MSWPRASLHVVSGKGGTGKSTVAAALALALASDGQHVLLCEVEGRQGIARLFGVEPLPYAEKKLGAGLDGASARPGTVHALHVDPESALLEHLREHYRLGRAARLLQRYGIVEFATTIAPGARDVLLTGKVFEAVVRETGRTYDTVVVDAPPTGRIVPFLAVNSEVSELAESGPLREQVAQMAELFCSPRTQVHLVTLLEEMPVQETHEGIEQLRERGLHVGSVFMNQTRPRDLATADVTAALDGTLDRVPLEKDLQEVVPDASPALLAEFFHEVRDHAERRALEDRLRTRVEGFGVPTYELERLPHGIDPGGLYDLATELREQGIR
ncbi:P-loop NTPase [Nocardioides panacisoli]|uniref:ArsA-related P-loop ATPase n=1 Tax=Nocardioides panacisoli TaxID=627624 RepID=UPI001C625E15|nr:P-loop NTPase [Nocardioides panacisoli]